MIKATRKYVLDTQFFEHFAPFEHLSLVVAQELRAGVKRTQDR